MSKKPDKIKRAMPTLSREAVISYLSRAGTVELVETILAALEQNPSTKPHKDGDCEARAVLALAFRNRDESSDQNSPEMYVIGAADGSKNGSGWSRGELPLCQSEKCQSCGVRVISHVKQAICPVCDGAVYLT